MNRRVARHDNGFRPRRSTQQMDLAGGTVSRRRRDGSGRGLEINGKHGKYENNGNVFACCWKLTFTLTAQEQRRGHFFAIIMALVHLFVPHRALCRWRRVSDFLCEHPLSHINERNITLYRSNEENVRFE